MENHSCVAYVPLAFYLIRIYWNWLGLSMLNGQWCWGCGRSHSIGIWWNNIIIHLYARILFDMIGITNQPTANIIKIYTYLCAALVKWKKNNVEYLTQGAYWIANERVHACTMTILTSLQIAPSSPLYLIHTRLTSLNQYPIYTILYTK